MPYGEFYLINKKRQGGEEEVFRKAVGDRATSEISTILPEPVFIGREGEFEELQLYLNSACEGKGSVVLVSGEAGAGKTRLLNEFVRAAKKKKEVTLLTGWCVSNTADPYFSFVKAFNGYFKSSEESGYSQSKRKETQIG